MFRDSGLPGDAVSEKLVGELPSHLAEDAFGTITISWIAGDDLTARPRAWLEGSGCDAWILHTAREDPLRAAASWNRPLGGAAADAEERLDAWLEYYARLGIEAIAYGAVDPAPSERRRQLGAVGGAVVRRAQSFVRASPAAVRGPGAPRRGARRRAARPAARARRGRALRPDAAVHGRTVGARVGRRPARRRHRLRRRTSTASALRSSPARRRRAAPARLPQLATELSLRATSPLRRTATSCIAAAVRRRTAARCRCASPRRAPRRRGGTASANPARPPGR